MSAEQAQVQPAKPRRTRRSRSRKPKPTILFVDDEPRVLNSMRALFRRDYDLHLTTRGSEAVEILRDNKIDVIVADQRMPEMTGVEVLGAGKEVSPNTVRILLTGYADLDAIEGSINIGEVFRFLSKPCPPSHLKETLRLAVEIARTGGRASNEAPPAVRPVPKRRKLAAADAADAAARQEQRKTKGRQERRQWRLQALRAAPKPAGRDANTPSSNARPAGVVPGSTEAPTADAPVSVQAEAEEIVLETVPDKGRYGGDTVRCRLDDCARPTAARSRRQSTRRSCSRRPKTAERTRRSKSCWVAVTPIRGRRYRDISTDRSTSRCATSA